MRPDNSSESLVAMINLKFTRECLFNSIRSDLHLMPILYNHGANLDHEKDYHSFVGDIVCDRWDISRLRKYLWGVLFYWLCDCNEIKEVLKYNDSIHRLKR